MMTPEDFFPLLFLAARFKHGTITPCHKKTWLECVTIDDGIVRLWYNSSETKSTHIVAFAYRDAAEGERP